LGAKKEKEMNTVLFGIDVVAVLLALLKLVADTFELSESVVKWLRAIVVAVSVTLLGLQDLGILFGPESEQVVLLVLSVVAAFLVTMGYAPAAIGTVVAVSDSIRLSACAKWATVLGKTQSAATVVDEIERRYGLKLE